MITVLGEALVDLTPDAGDGWPTFTARPGGSPMNVAVGLARLGIDAAFLGRLSSDGFGRRLRSHLDAEGVGIADAPVGDEPTAVAIVVEEAAGYRFLWDGTADRMLSPSELPVELGHPGALHVGSVSTLLEPGATTVRGLVEREADRRVVCYDPNLRPSITPDRAWVRTPVEELVRAAGIVKVSEEDLRWLARGRDPVSVAEAWALQGPQLVVLTRGADGAEALLGSSSVTVPGHGVEVADTVGAGDAFTAGLLAWLERHDRLRPDALAGLSTEEARAATAHGVAAASVAVSRPGADPPRTDELPDPT